MLRAILVDDERLARKRLRALLEAHPEIAIIGEADGVDSAAALAARERPDVVFLDVQMPPGSGFDLLPLLDPLPAVVFVTAYETFAVRAFEASALDYLLKPVHPDRLAKTIRRLRAAPRFEHREHDAVEIQRLEPHDLVTLRDRGTLRIVEARRIAVLEAEGAYTRVSLADGGSMLVLRLLGDWDAVLPPEFFARISRSVLINLRLVRDVETRTRDETLVGLEGVAEALILGRAPAARLRKLLI